jgi:hypothetical protein
MSAMSLVSRQHSVARGASIEQRETAGFVATRRSRPVLPLVVQGTSRSDADAVRFTTR